MSSIDLAAMGEQLNAAKAAHAGLTLPPAADFTIGAALQDSETLMAEVRRLRGMTRWTMPDIATHLGVRLETVHAYRSRAKNGHGTMPAPTGVIGRTPYWSDAAIGPWLEGQLANRRHIGREAKP